MTKSRFGRYTWFVLIFNLFVILWGGFVSASGSGDGCGESWPLCAEAAERTTTGLETFIELFHRGTSGLALIAVLAMLVWSRRLYPAGSPVRKAVFWSLAFELGEAAIGALIVIFGLVAENESLARAFTQPIHLVNTYLLLAALALTVWLANGRPTPHRHGNRRTLRLLLPVLLGLLLLSAFGTIASLASTIFPSESFLAGVQSDFSRSAHYLVRLRIIHPILATLLGLYLLWLGRVLRDAYPAADRLFFAVLMLFAVQYALGALNAILLAPIWLQLVHLLVSDLLWLGLVALSAQLLSQSEASPARTAVAQSTS